MSDFAQDFRLLSSMVEPVDVKITAKKDPEKPYVGLENMPSREARLLGWESASSSISTNSVFSIGDVLFGKLRPNLRKCVVAPFDGYCSTDILVLRAKEGVDSGFAGKIFQTEQVGVAAERTAIGTKMPRTSWGHLKEVSVFCPEIEEQKLIAQILDTLDTAIHETEALIDKLKAVKQGLLHDLLTRGIDANGQLRPPQSEAPQLYKESPLGWIPREWDCTTVAAIADVKSGATPSRAMAHLYYGTTGINWVKTLDLNEGLIFETDERITAQGLRGSSCVEFPAGTVLVAMYGGWEQIGRTGLLAVKAATNQAISALLFRTENVCPEFILRAMQHGRPRWQQVAASTRKDPNITKADVMEFLLPVPPKSEQEMIAGRYRSVLDQLQIEQQQALKLEQQKSGLMDDLLTGRVRVTPLLESVQQPAAQTEA